jgi:hypothetical protein
MADDLEAFLRQAAQRRAQRQSTAPRPAAPAAPLTARLPLSVPPPPRAPLTPTPAPPAAAPKVAPPRLTPEAQVSRVGTRVDTAGFGQRAEHLGEEVGLADEQMEAHIAQKFDHQVGSMGPGDSTQTGAEIGALAFDAADLAALLKNPNSLRQAVLLSEILNPPHFRR